MFDGILMDGIVGAVGDTFAVNASSGTIVTGRICYDAFVLDNKKVGIYYQETT